MTIPERYVYLVLVGEVIVFATGIWVGRHLSKPAPGEVVVGWREIWRHGPDPDRYKVNPKILPVFLSAFGGCFVAGGVRWLSEYVQSFLLAGFSTFAVLLCIAIGWGALLAPKSLRKL